MEVISSIYNSGHNIKKFYLGSRELNLAYLGNQVIYDEVIGDNDLNYILYEFYGSDTLPNTVEAPVKRAILKGKTDENLQSVKLPVLKTTGKNLFDKNKATKDAIIAANGQLLSLGGAAYTDYIRVENGKTYINTIGSTIAQYDINKTFISRTTATKKFVATYDGYIRWNLGSFDTMDTIQIEESSISTSYEPYKSNILTVNEDVTLRSNGDVYDELNLLTGRLTQRIDENNEVLAQEVVKTVDLTIVDQDGKTINKLNSFNGTTHVSTEVAENSAYPMVSLEVASELQTAMSKIAEDIELIKPVQNDIETTLDTQSNDIDSLLLATTELFEMFL